MAKKNTGKTAKKSPIKKSEKKPVAKPIAKKPTGKISGKTAAKVIGKKLMKTAIRTAKKVSAAVLPAAQPVQSKTISKTISAKNASPKSQLKSQAKLPAARRFMPLDDRILVERVVAPEKTTGGLYIPDSAQEKPTVGRVVAVGRGHRDAKGRTRPCDVQVGDSVLFTAWSGSEIEVDGTLYVLMRESDLLGVTNA